MAFPDKRFLAVLVCCIVVSFSINAPAADGKAKILILPFGINSEKDLTFLQNGIFDMISSRLTSDGRLIPASREEARDALLNSSVPPGVSAGADYVVHGSLTVFGDSASIDAKVFSMETEKAVLVFTEQCRELGEVIPKIGLFASAIPAAIFEGRTPTKSAPVQVPAVKTPKPESEPPVVEAPPEKGTSAVAVASRAPSEDTWEMSWKSREMNTMITGIASGDVDNDGKNEVVLLVPGEIWIFRFQDKKYQKIKEIELDDLNLVGVDTADINANGFSEIFVTALALGRDYVSSLVLEWDGNGFSKIAKNKPCYYRVVNISGRGPVLFGQKDKEEKGPFFGDITEMVWRDSGYEPGKIHYAGNRFNALGFVTGNALNDGRTITAAFENSDRLEILGPAGGSIWKSDKKYGGNTQYYVAPGELHDEEAHHYLPVRLRVRDLDSDGRNEIVTIQNEEYLSRHLEAYRNFTNTQIVSLSADGSMVREGWKTKQLSGRITDFVIADFDNDGKEELGVALVVKEKSILGRGAVSVVVVYEFG